MKLHDPRGLVLYHDSSLRVARSVVRYLCSILRLVNECNLDFVQGNIAVGDYCLHKRLKVGLASTPSQRFDIQQ